MIRRKKVTKEKERLLRENTIEKVRIISTILKRTYLYYKAIYNESDRERLVMLVDALHPERVKERYVHKEKYNKLDFFSVTKALLTHKKH